MREKAKRNRRSERDYHEKDLEGKKENIVSHSKKRILLPSYFVCPVWKVKLFKGTSFIVLFTF